MHNFQLTSFDLGEYCLLEILLLEVQRDVGLSIHDLTLQEFLRVLRLYLMDYFHLYPLL